MEPGLVFVFPSQVAAESHARAFCLSGRAASVETARFAGWDKFKAAVFSPEDSRRPADRVTRSIWAAGVLERQRREAFLSILTGPGDPAPGFLRNLSTMPPRLASTVRAIRSADPGLRADAETAFMCADLEALYRDYSAFLSECGLFEPDWMPKASSMSSSRFLIFAPLLIEDFGEYRERIAAMGEVECVDLDELATPETSLPVMGFPNAREELRWVFGRIAALLDSGEGPEDIILTATGMERAAPHILRAAREWGVPVTLKAGRMLSATHFGRFLAAAGACARRDFDFPSVRGLLLDGATPWKEAGTVRDLIRFGIAYHIHSGYGSGETRVDIWRKTFTACAPHSPLAGFNAKLQAGIRGLTGSGSFEQLRERLMKFRRDFFDEEGMEADEERIVERIMEELGSLCDAEALLASSRPVPDPFSLLLLHLGAVNYMPQTGEGSVAVFPYRVSALTAVRHHFILGCSEESTKVTYTSGAHLPEALKSGLGMTDLDVSKAFMRAYTGDPGCVPCFATEDFTGWSAGRADFATPMPPEDYDSIRASDPVLGETAAWRCGVPLPARLAAWQLRAMLGNTPNGGMGAAAVARYATAPVFARNDVTEGGERVQSGRSWIARPPLLVASGGNFSRGLSDKASRDYIVRSKTDGEGYLRLSASTIKDYKKCPFAWLLKRALNLGEEPSGIGFFDNKLAGEMAHALIRELYQRIAEDGPYDPGRADTYKSEVDALASVVLARFTLRKGPFLEPMFEAYLPLLADRIRRLVDAEEVYAGWMPGVFEVGGRKVYPGIGAVLEGVADRIASKGDSLALIDYKKRKTPDRSSLFLTEATPAPGASAGRAPRLGDCQIAAYIRLFEDGSRRVEKAAFYSIEDAEWLDVIGGAKTGDREGYEAEIEAFELDLAEVAERIRSGDFRISPPAGAGGADTCENCEWRAVCRSRFATE